MRKRVLIISCLTVAGCGAVWIATSLAAKGKMEATVGGRFGIDTFGIGEDTGQPVTFDYKPPFRFTGEIEKVTVEVK